MKQIAGSVTLVVALVALVLIPAQRADAQPTCFGLEATIIARPGVATVGTPGPDVIVGTRGPDLIRGGGGADRICSRAGDDAVFGGAGHDKINLGPGNDTAEGGRGRDLITGKSGQDVIFGNAGKDNLLGGGAADRLVGGGSDDRLSGQAGNDRLDGSIGNDDCSGGSGNDTFLRCLPTLRGGIEPFDGGLEPGWRWESGDPARRSFSAVPGALRLRGSPGFLANALVRDPVADDFVLETKVRFRPTQNFQGAGLIVRARGGNTGIALIRSYCDTDSVCVGDGVYLDRFKQGEIANRNAALPPGTRSIHLRLEHRVGTYTGWYSVDGKTWTLVGAWQRNFVPTTVGIWTGGAISGPVPAADFYHYEERSAPPLPGFEPGRHIVGAEIPPGRYVSEGGVGCNWERLSALDDDPSSVIAAETRDHGGPVIVDISPGDTAFSFTAACGTFREYAPPLRPLDSIGPGSYVVGSDIETGFLEAPDAKPGCEWKLLFSFSGEAGSAGITGQADGPTRASVTNLFEGFYANSNCGTWQQ